MLGLDADSEGPTSGLLRSVQLSSSKSPPDADAESVYSSLSDESWLSSAEEGER